MMNLNGTYRSRRQSSISLRQPNALDSKLLKVKQSLLTTISYEVGGIAFFLECLPLLERSQ